MIERNPVSGALTISWVSDTHVEKMTYYDFTPTEAVVAFLQKFPHSAADIVPALYAYIREGLDPHLVLANKILEPFAQSSLFEDYQDEDGWTSDQFWNMITVFKSFGDYTVEDDEE